MGHARHGGAANVRTLAAHGAVEPSGAENLRGTLGTAVKQTCRHLRRRGPWGVANSRGMRGTTAYQTARAVYLSAGVRGTRSDAFERLKPKGAHESSMGALEAGWRSRGVHTNHGGVESVRRIMTVATRPTCYGAGFGHGGKDAPGAYEPEDSTRICSHKAATRRRPRAGGHAQAATRRPQQ
jgi:hypothetical protein